MYLLHSMYVPMYMHDTIILQTPPHFWSTYNGSLCCWSLIIPLRMCGNYKFSMLLHPL